MFSLIFCFLIAVFFKKKMKSRKIIIAITGASGSIYAKLLLNRLLKIQEKLNNIEIGIVLSGNAKTVWLHELGDMSIDSFPFNYYDKRDFFAPFASGSAQYDTMIICPCSMGTLGRIVHGISDDLITRSADVILKERRRLILVVRETPYSVIHLQNMLAITQAGAIICPASPSFYSRPATFEQLAATVIDRVLDLAGFEVNTYRWGDDLA
jgi:4-hydroxy-3-polyprenylbenzoate decarboxylase